MLRVTELARLVGWTGRGVRSVDWSHIERELGFMLPSEYKAHVEVFPNGVFQHALRVMQPETSDDVEGYLDAVRYAAQNIREIPEEISELSLGVYPAVPGLFPWGNIEGELLLCWHLTDRSSNAPASYLISLLRGSTIKLEGSMSECIASMIRGHIPELRKVLATDKPPTFAATPLRPERVTLQVPERYWTGERRAHSRFKGLAGPADATDDLLSLGLETHRAQRVEWQAVESRLGQPLPNDYKRFIERIGPGRYGQITVASPTGATKDAPGMFDILSMARESAEATYTNPPAMFPEAGAPLIWGMAPGDWFLGWTPGVLFDGERVVTRFCFRYSRSEVRRSMTSYLYWYLTQGEDFSTAPWSVWRPRRV